MSLIKKVKSIITVTKKNKKDEVEEICVFHVNNRGLPKSIVKEINAILTNNK